ncbi:J domain-containing protein [Pseudomonas sp. Marseille-QA0892]
MHTTFWETLGLDDDADERAIKRAYARLLKQNRPDDDPEAFQRLRNAYEDALEDVRWRAEQEDALEEDAYPAAATPAMPVTMVEQVAPRSQPLDAAPATFDVDPWSAFTLNETPLAEPAPPPVDIEAWFELPLDEALEQARNAGQVRAFELGLLERCVEDGSVEVLPWAQENLGWFSPGQSDYLPRHDLEMLAQRLMTQALGDMHEALVGGQERHAMAVLQSALASDWLQPFDYRSSFEARLLDYLWQEETWTPAFFERLCDLLGWREEHGHLPCGTDQWDALCRRCEAYELHNGLKRSLAVAKPTTARDRAAWFLLKPMTAGERRLFADDLSEADWQACVETAGRVERRGTELANELEGFYLEDWRAWWPHGGWRAAYVYIAVVLSVAFSAVGLLRRSVDSVGDAFVTVALASFVGIIMVVPLKWAAMIWAALARACTRADVAISVRLFPEMARGGAGVLLLRHLVPCFCLAGLLWVWARAVPALANTLALGMFIGSLKFVQTIKQGNSPTAWISELSVQLPWLGSLLKRAFIFLAIMMVLAAIRILFS